MAKLKALNYREFEECLRKVGCEILSDRIVRGHASVSRPKVGKPVQVEGLKNTAHRLGLSVKLFTCGDR